MEVDFNNISVVPIGEEFIDLLLSRVHRQTPTKGFDILRLRQFYTHMVTKTELTYRDKLSTILHEFPNLDDIHPFYTHLLRSIFDGDRYEFALGQVNTAKDLISKISDDYVNLLEFSESLKQCRSLKVNAIGGMFSVVNEITHSLAYLEQLRQHMVKLPLIDLNLPTLLVSGYTNVDKSCFMNRIEITAESETFDVGCSEYNGLKYQVIDAPGVLDKPTFGDCDVVATALACHLRVAVVLFFLDVSGSCGYSVAHQAALLHSVRSLFGNRRLLIVCDETQLMQVSDQDWELVKEMSSGMGAIEEEEEEVILPISDLRTEEGMMNSGMGENDDEEEEDEEHVVVLPISDLRTEEGMMSSGMGANDDEEDEEHIVVLPISDLRTEEGIISLKKAACESLLDCKERPSCIAWMKAKNLRDKAHRESQDNTSPQNLDDDDDDKVSDLFVDSGVTFSLEEWGHEETLKQPENENEEEEFVMAEERFIEEHNDQVVAIVKKECFITELKDEVVAIGKKKKKIQPLRVVIALALCIFVGNTYGGAIQQCLSTFLAIVDF